MFKPTIADRIIHVCITKTRKIKTTYRRKALNNKNFTIISNKFVGEV